MPEVTKRIHRVDGVNANPYLVIEDGGTVTLVDTGIPPDGKKILAYLAGFGKKPEDVSNMVITHSHIDHIRGAARLKSATGAKVGVHEADADYLSGKKKFKAAGAMGILFAVISPLFSVTPVEPDVRLKEGDMVGRLRVIHTPGHTPGSAAFFDEAERALFVGDTVRYIDGKLVGPPPNFTVDMQQAKASMTRLSKLDFRILLSGHGDPLVADDAAKQVGELAEKL
ncbi:MAG TPA: MBL fold metallo-hydrolase [Nitrososphaerales archaeon]|nr:MBL fold metallo-hydrolase [Nitrososphaerales archaeon]